MLWFDAVRPEYILHGKTEIELQQAAVDYLLSTGAYTIGLAFAWETKEAFCRRVGISARTFSRRMTRRHVPTVKVERGPGGRIVQLRSNPEFESYMRRKR